MEKENLFMVNVFNVIKVLSEWIIGLIDIFLEVQFRPSNLKSDSFLTIDRVAKNKFFCI